MTYPLDGVLVLDLTHVVAALNERQVTGLGRRLDSQIAIEEHAVAVADTASPATGAPVPRPDEHRARILARLAETARETG